MTTCLADAPDWVEWFAQDADGAWWGYEAEPNQQHNGWYENEVGRIVRLGQDAPPADWTAMLVRRSGLEDRLPKGRVCSRSRRRAP